MMMVRIRHLVKGEYYVVHLTAYDVSGTTMGIYTKQHEIYGA